MKQQLPVERVVEGLRKRAPVGLSSLKGHDYPDSGLTEENSNNIEQSSDQNAVFYLVYYSNNSWFSVFPLDVDETRENSHEVGGGPYVRLVVEFIHEFWLRRHFGIWYGVAPIVDHDHYEGSNDRGDKQKECYKPAELFIFGIGVEEERCDQEELEVDSQIPSLNNVMSTHPKQQSIPLGPWLPKLSIKNMFHSTPPSLHEQERLQKILHIGPLPKQGAIFQYMRIATIQVGQIRINLCSTAPKQNLMKLLAFLTGYSMPIVIRKPPIQKKVSTAKQAAGTKVGTPGVVNIQMVSVQFFMLMNLNHMSWPKTIQKMDRTLTPFKKSKFSFSVCLGMCMILVKLSQRLKDLKTLTVRLWLYVILLMNEPIIPTRTSVNKKAIVRQLLQSMTGLAKTGLQNLSFTKGWKVEFIAVWQALLSESCTWSAVQLDYMTDWQSLGTQNPMFWSPPTRRLTTCMVKQVYQFLLKRQLLQSPRSLRNFPESAQMMGGRLVGFQTQSRTRSMHWFCARDAKGMSRSSISCCRCMYSAMMVIGIIFNTIRENISIG